MLETLDRVNIGNLNIEEALKEFTPFNPRTYIKEAHLEALGKENFMDPTRVVIIGQDIRDLYTVFPENNFFKSIYLNKQRLLYRFGVRKQKQPWEHRLDKLEHAFGIKWLFPVVEGTDLLEEEVWDSIKKNPAPISGNDYSTTLAFMSVLRQEKMVIPYFEDDTFELLLQGFRVREEWQTWDRFFSEATNLKLIDQEKMKPVELSKYEWLSVEDYFKEIPPENIYHWLRLAADILIFQAEEIVFSPDGLKLLKTSDFEPLTITPALPEVRKF
ncbi:MAG: hypothetical protein Q7R49_01680 [Candidatus Daviesbacteria bacterium]|nr:hypothetical protein [Candidatus Daviesbacteria bacterium]